MTFLVFVLGGSTALLHPPLYGQLLSNNKDDDLQGTTTVCLIEQRQCCPSAVGIYFCCRTLKLLFLIHYY